jgi:diguanylate cyclase (GGDEF)-like protein
MNFATILQTALRDSDVIGRLGGDEFVAILTDTTFAATSNIMLRLRKALDKHNSDAQCSYDIRYSVGQIECDVARHPSIKNLLAQADAAMYAHKRTAKSTSEAIAT